MISDIDNVLLIKYLRGELDEYDSQLIVDWLQQKDENKEFLFGLKDMYMLSRWKELKSRSGATEGWQELLGEIEPEHTGSFKRGLRIGFRYAAVVLVVFSLGYYFKDFFPIGKISYNTVQTDAGERSTIVLNDGTKVKLNENTKLIYPNEFRGGFRKVSLQGEAYFEVAPNAKKPFLVNVGLYTVKVLGTKFDVDAYPGNICSYTSLKEGKVQIVENTKEANILSELKPGTQIVINTRTGKYHVKAVDKSKIADWRSGLLVMHHESLEDLAESLRQKFGYSIEIQTDSIGWLLYNLTVENETLEEILGDIRLMTPQVHYTVNQKEKTVVLR
jgi:transmembrane sensor